MNAPTLGLDLGGTDVKGVVLDAHGAVTHEVRRPSYADASALDALHLVVAAALELRERAGVAPAAAGIGLPGMVDVARGALVGRTPHLAGAEDLDVRGPLEAALGVPVEVENDANCAALAEQRLGAARGARVALAVNVGTGVGCGIVIDGAIFRGAHGGAGEIGHLAMGDGALPCDCGVANCVEPMMCASGLVRAARDAGLDVQDARDVFARAAAGEATAAKLVERLGDRLAAATAAAVHLFDPDVVVIGGGVAEAGEAVLAPLRRGWSRYLMTSHSERVRLERAKLGALAGAVGAALRARSDDRIGRVSEPPPLCA